MKKILFVLLLSAATVPALAQTNADSEALAQQVLRESSKQTSEDLRETMAEVKRQNRKKELLRQNAGSVRDQQGKQRGQAATLQQGNHGTQGILIGMRPADHAPAPHGQASLGDVQKQADTLQNQKDSQSEVGQDPGLHIQELTDRRQKAQRILSNTLKKQSDTQSGVVQNMK